MPRFQDATHAHAIKELRSPKALQENLWSTASISDSITGTTAENSKPHECIIHAVRGPENILFWQELERLDNTPAILLPFLRRVTEANPDGWGAKLPVGMWGATLQEWEEVLECVQKLEHWNDADPQLVIRLLSTKNGKVAANGNEKHL